jgi:hypothetical protein
MGPRGVGLLHCKPWRGSGVHVLAYRGFALTGARPRAVLQDTGGRHAKAPADRGVGVARFDVARFGIIGCGGVPEWLIGAVSKTVVRLWRTVGSNPTPSATAPFGISKWLEHTASLSLHRSPRGGVPEWTIGHAWKACVPFRVPWVRIPPPPPRFAVQTTAGWKIEARSPAATTGR